MRTGRMALAGILCWPAWAQQAGGNGLPAWLKVRAEVRGRVEADTGLGYAPSASDGYYLHRLRLNAAIEAGGGLGFFFQAQDSQAPGYRKPVPDNLANTLDLRQAYLEMGRMGKSRWSLRLGRQELLFGEERLVGGGNWGNVSRSFDAARLTFQSGKVRWDAFASALVAPRNRSFDRFGTDNRLHGLYGSVKDWLPGATIEPYFLWKSNRPGKAEIGTFGLRAEGKLGHGVDYGVEAAGQTGEAANEDVRAWAGHWLVGKTVGSSAKAPRLLAEYNYASGDGDPRDGRRGTFDQLFPTNHSKYGIVDRVGWRNMHNPMVGVELKPATGLRVRLDYHSFWLASRAEALYTDGGGATVRNGRASSSHVGQEVDLHATYQYSEQLQFQAGVGRLVAGRFLKESSGGSGVTGAYVQWLLRL